MTLIRDMFNADYHASPALGNSGISALAETPRHYFALYLAPDRPVRKTTVSKRRGTITHCAVLEPVSFSDRYIVKPAGLNLSTVAGRAWAADVPPGREVVTEDDVARCKAQRAAVLAVPELAALLEHGEAEVSAFWTDAETGVECKCRPDFVHTLADGRVIILDLKTAADVSPRGFGRSARKYGYRRQAAWYSRGYALASGLDVAEFIFAAVTNTYPYIAAMHIPGEAVMRQGAEQCGKLLRLYADCMKSGIWPAYGSGPHVMELAPWEEEFEEGIEVEYV